MHVEDPCFEAFWHYQYLKKKLGKLGTLLTSWQIPHGQRWGVT